MRHRHPQWPDCLGGCGWTVNPAAGGPVHPTCTAPADAIVEHNQQPARARAAVQYATAGVPVLALYEAIVDSRCASRDTQCDRQGKHPRLKHGHQDATTDPATVQGWWRRWPGANVGAATGHLFDVWDIDLPEPAAGELITELLGGVMAPTVRTGSGGTHVFVAPTGSGNRSKFLPGCDWRGAGGYVVLPPSRHLSGQTYQWLITPRRAGGFPPAPPALAEALSRVDSPRVGEPMGRATAGERLQVGSSRYAATAVGEECVLVAAAVPGQRNHTLNTAAYNLGQLVGAGLLAHAAAEAALTDAAARAGLGKREAARTIASGLTAGARNPRTVRTTPGAAA
jgi:hypothetical protein